MSRARTIAWKAFLGYLVAEWLGALLAYAVALLSFSFLIVYLVTASMPGAVALVPLVTVLSGAGLIMLWKALGVPRALLRQVRRGTEPEPIRGRESQSGGVRARPRNGDWRATRTVNRVGAVMGLDESRLGARSGALSIGTAELKIRELSPGPRLRPTLGAIAPRFGSVERIPVLSAEGPARVEPIRIVDLADAGRPSSADPRR